MGIDSALSREADFHELEQQELITAEPRYPEDEARNAFLATILGGLAALVLLIAMIMGWVLYYRHRSGTMLAYPIVFIFIILFAGACAAWGAGSRSAIISKRQPNQLFSLVVFMGSLASMTYLISMAMYLVYYIANHYDFLVGMFSVPGKSELRFKSTWSFDDAWKDDRRIFYWIITFTLVAGICFAFIAYAAANVVMNKYALIRYSLYFTLAGMTLASWLTIYWAEEAYHQRVLIDNEQATGLVKALKVVAIISLVLAFLNMIANLLKMKLGYFVMGIACLVMLIILVTVDAPLWRQMRKEAKDEYNDGSDRNCKVSMYNVHEDALGAGCVFNGGKYLPAGTSCGKDFLVNRWEGGALTDLRSLNTACCLSAKHVFLYPYLQTALWGLVLLITMALSMIFNFYLADTTEYLTNYNKSLNLADYLGIAAILLLSIGWGIYFIARSAHEDASAPSKVNYILSYMDPNKNPVDGWTQVPPGFLNTVNPKLPSQPATGSICYKYDTTAWPKPSFQTTGTTCNDAGQCFIRMAVAVGNSAILQFGDIGTANRASGDNRYVFFPQCANVIESNGYALFYGDEGQIKKVLDNMKICPQSVADTPTLYFYSDQVKKDDISNNGLVPGEVLSNDAANQNSGLCGNGFTSTSCATTATCKYSATMNTQAVTRTLKGKFYYISNGQKMYDVPNTIGFGAKDNSGNVGNLPMLYNDGTFVIQNIPVYKDSPYRLRLTISDSDKSFLSSYEDIVIDTKTAGATEISAGEIRLDTKDGLVCLPFYNDTCVKAQVHEKGDINLIVFDGSNAAVVKPTNRIQGVSVSLYMGHVVDGTAILTTTSDNNGAILFKGIPYGPYTLIGSRDGFAPSAVYLDLQSPNNNPKPLVMLPSVSDYDMQVSADMMNPVADFDLILQMKSPEGKECEINPYTKYCPYSVHTSDITTGPGTETIMVRQLAVATYNSFVRQSPLYDDKCSAKEFVNSKAYHFQQKNLNWDSAHMEANVISKILPGTIFTSQSSGTIDSDLSFTERILRSIPIKPLVETVEDQAKSRMVIRSDNIALAAVKQFARNTAFTANNTGFIPTSASSYVSQASSITTPFTYEVCANPPTDSTDCINGTRSIFESNYKDKVRQINYTKAAGTVTTSYSNETHDITYTNNASIVDDDYNLTSSKNSADSTSVNKTQRSFVLATPSDNNMSLTSDGTVSLLANKSITKALTETMVINSINGTKGSVKLTTSSTTTPGGPNFESLTFKNTTSTTAVTKNGNNTGLQSTGSINITSSKITTSTATNLDYTLSRQETYTNGTLVTEKNTTTISPASNSFDYSIDIKHATDPSITIGSTYFANKSTETLNPSLGDNTTVATLTDNINYPNATSSHLTSSVTFTQKGTTSATIANTTETTKVFTGKALGTTADKAYDITVRSNYSLDSTFNSTGVTAESATILFERKTQDDYDINYTVGIDPVVASCKVLNASQIRRRSNNTETLRPNVTRTCIYRNGSTITYKSVTFIQIASTSTGKTYLNNSNITIDIKNSDGTTAHYDLTSSADALPAAPGPKRRRLEETPAAHAATVSGAGSFIWINCFTGYGDKSLISINSIQDTLPSLNDCVNKIKTDKQDYTMDKLKDAVANYKP